MHRSAGPTHGPIYVGGTARSGKTLVRSILSSHPRIAVSRRTDLWPRFYGRFGDLAVPRNLERCLEAMFARPQVAALGTDVDRLLHDLRKGPPTYARLFAAIHEQWVERLGKERWGDHTAMIERFAEHLVHAHPDATVVHMVRDPRDVVQAVVERGGRGLGAVGRTVAAWRESIDLARRNASTFGGSYVVVTYESMVTRPTETVRRICDAAGERFDPAMVLLEGAARYRRADAPPAGVTPIVPDHVARYRGRLDAGTVAFIQSSVGDRMRALGYELDSVRPRAAHRLGWALVRGPAEAAGMRRWDVRGRAVVPRVIPNLGGAA